MKIRTDTILVDAIDQDFIWRKKELTHLRFLLESANGKGDKEDTLLRGGITLLYAHWEGFIKYSALSYLEFVANQSLRYEQLAAPLLALAARPILNSVEGSKRITNHLKVTEFYTKGLSQKGSLPYKDGITTRSNLSSEVLFEITQSLGLSYSEFEPKANLIDETLLRTRNTVAHGEYLLITAARFLQLTSEVLGMMEQFRTQVQNAAVLRLFKVA